MEGLDEIGRRECARGRGEKKSVKEQAYENLKFALGRLGWSVYDYYTSLPIEFYAAVAGHQEAEAERAKVLRFASYRVAEAMAGSKALGSIDRFWPMGEGETKKTFAPPTKEIYEEIMKRHNIKLKTNG